MNVRTDSVLLGLSSWGHFDYSRKCGGVFPNGPDGSFGLKSARRFDMLGAAILFFILALVALLFGYSGIAGLASSVAWVFLIVFAVLTVITLLVHLFRGPGRARY